MTNDYPHLTQKQIDNIASCMDDEIREMLHTDLSPCHPGEFLTAYLARDTDFPIEQFDTSISSMEPGEIREMLIDNGARTIEDMIRALQNGATLARLGIYDQEAVEELHEELLEELSD
jgi:hypothetical protein